MPLQLPNLDDRRYADLVEEARAQIPTFAPEWTNHNPSDPGITLIELFAFLSEMLIYRLNRVTSANVLSFLKLLNGTDWNPFEKEQKKLLDSEKEQIATRLKNLPPDELATLVARQLTETALRLRQIDRTVSGGDFETLALKSDERVARARCLPRRNMELDPERERAGHVSVIILPRMDPPPPDPPIKLPGLIAQVKNSLTPKLLLTTRLHVVGPRFLTVVISNVNVVSLPDEKESDLKPRIIEAVKNFLDPHGGGEDGNGWPFGRNVFVSELYSLLDQLSGVDYVKTEPGSAITLTSPTPGRLITNADGKLVGIEVKPYELVMAQITLTDVTVQSPVA
jgi:hypothetical protein